MPDVFLLSYGTGEFEVIKELLDSHVQEALSGQMRIVDVHNLNFMNAEGEWEDIEGKDDVDDDEMDFKRGARRYIDPNLLWAYCKQRY